MKLRSKMKSKRIWFRKWPLKSIAYIFWFRDFWIKLEWGGYENDEVIINIWLAFFEIRIKLNTTVNTQIIKKLPNWDTKWLWDKQRTFGFMFNRKYLSIGYGKPWNWIENETTISFWYDRLLPKAFREPKYIKEHDLEWNELTLYIPDMYEKEKTNKHAYRYRYGVQKWKYPFFTRTREFTEIESIGEPPRIPWKWTTSYNCDDDATYAYFTVGRLSKPEIIKLIAGNTAFYRSYYPL